MSYYAPSGATLALAANATSGTVLGDVSAFPIAPGMALAPGSRSGIDGPTRIITSWTPTTSPVGATFTIDSAFSGGVAFAAGTPFVVDNLATPGSIYAQNNLAVTTLLNALKKWFGLSTTLDQASKSLPFDRGSGSSTFTELMFQLVGRKWFGWEHRTISGTERLLGRTYVDGATATDSIDINGSDGTVDYKIGESTIAAAATTNLGTGRTRKVTITGNTGITSFGSTPNLERVLRFTGAPTITHNATSLIIPGAANITVAAGDTMRVTSDASGNWRILSWTRASGLVAFAFAATPTGPTGTAGADGLMSTGDKVRVDGMPTGMNLVPNAMFEKGLSNWLAAGLTTAVVSIVTGATNAPGPNYGRITLTGQNTGSPRFDGTRFPVVPGRQYALGAYYRGSKVTTGSTIVLRVYWWKGDGSAASTALNSINLQSATAWTRAEQPFTAPADATYAYFTFLVNSTVADSEALLWADVTDCEIKEVIESVNLIKNGALTNALLASVATSTIKGRKSAGTGAPEDLTVTDARTVLGLGTGDSPTLTALTLTGTAGITLGGPAGIKSYTVATLPAAGAAGRVAYATDGRALVSGGTVEASGSGTGTLVVSNGTNWKVAGTNITVTAT